MSSKMPESSVRDLRAARAMLTKISHVELLDMVENGKLRIGSKTDEDLNRRPSFASKTVTEAGDPTEKRAIGFTCRKGLKPEYPNQDSWCILKVKDFSIYVVCDGHGPKGHDISDFVQLNFPKVLLSSDFFYKDPLKALTETYAQMQCMIEVQTETGIIDATCSGSTVSAVLHRHTDGRLFVSHVGDSRCVIGRKQGARLRGVPLTVDHKPDNMEERQRIESCGGQVLFDGFTNFRVYASGEGYPGLNMSRALGDLMGYYDAGISAEPTLSDVQLRQTDRVLLVCSDGVWEFMSDQEAITCALPFLQGRNKNAQNAAEHLAKEAWDRWTREDGGLVVDDITVLVILLEDDLPDGGI